MKTTARQAAARALMQVLGQGGYSNLVLDEILEKEDLSPVDRSFCAALLYTTVQHSLTLDHALAAYSSQPVKKLSPVVLCCLRLGLCQLLYLDSVPENAAVHETVELCKTLGEPHAAGYVNGVLRGFLRAGRAVPTPKDPLTALSVRYSVPMPLIQLWRKGYGHQTALDILAGLESRPPIFLRANSLRCTAPELAQRLQAQGLAAQVVESLPGAVRLESIPGGVARLEAFKEGLFHVQDLSSQRCCHAAFAGGFVPKRALDLCAAPGGKSFTTAQLMLEKLAEKEGVSPALLLARDLYPARATLIEQGAARLGLGDTITARPGDATRFDSALGQFDLVLCDVVCSGFGILRRKPEIRYKPLQTLDGLPELQYNIVDTALGYLAPGGRLVYSTCTLNPAENQQVVARLLENHPALALCVPPTTLLPGDCGGDGFFYSVLERKE